MPSRTTAKAKTVAPSKPAAKPAPKPAPEPTPVQDKVQTPDTHSAMTTQTIKDNAQDLNTPAPESVQPETTQDNAQATPDFTETPSQSEQTTTRTTQKHSGRMTAVRFLRGYGVYNAGEIAAFKEPEADKLIALGHAEEL